MPVELSWQYVYAVVSVSMIAIAIAIAASTALRRVPSGKLVLALDVICAAVAAGATLFSATLPEESLNPLRVGTIIAIGISLAWMYARWGKLYSSLDIRHALAALFVSGIVGSFLKMALFLIPNGAFWAVLVLLPLIATMLFHIAKAHIPRAASATSHFGTMPMGMLGKVGVVFAVFSFANGCIITMQSNPPLAAGPLPFFAARILEVILCAGVLAYAFKLCNPIGFSELWRIILVLLSSAVLCSILAPQSNASQIFSSVSVNFVVLFVWLTLADIARHSTISPTLIFALGWTCYSLPFFIGSWGVTMVDFGAGPVPVLASILYLIALTSAFCLETRDRDMKLIFSDLNPEHQPSPSDYQDIDSRRDAIAKQHWLTARELEVMKLICKGRSKTYIAETLFVSENTVRGHAKRLYAKLNVHSKTELQQLIGLQ